MSEAIALPKSLRGRLEKLAAKTGESPQKLARDAIAAHLDYLDWREKAIRAGFESGEREGWNDRRAPPATCSLSKTSRLVQRT